MPRKGSVPKRDVLPDPIHNSKLVTKLINKIMLDGKRGTAQRILYSAFDLVEQRSGRDALEVFEEAINNIMPVLEFTTNLPQSTPRHTSTDACCVTQHKVPDQSSLAREIHPWTSRRP